MFIQLTHTTSLSYTDVVRDSVMELRVCPMQSQSQVRLGFDLAIGPAAQVHGYFDWLDNHVHAFAISSPHDRIEIAATSIVRTDAVPGQNAELEVALDRFGGTWPLGEAIDTNYVLYDFLHVDPKLREADAVKQLVQMLAPVEGEPVPQLVRRALRLTDELFTYEQGITSSDTTVLDFLEERRGVCQDFTHAFLVLMRCVGIPARYVSGILHADTDQNDLLGATQTHAWVDVLMPLADGTDHAWVGLDPTNQCVAGEQFVKVAVGRSYNDVPPNRGVFRGNAEEEMQVNVDTRQLREVPPEISAEQFRRLNVPGASDNVPLLVADGMQQQQQQQQ